MLTQLLQIFALPGMFRRESVADLTAPPRNSRPPSTRPSASDPPPRPQPQAAQGATWTAAIGGDPCSHERLAFASLFGYR
jgi:hypothetical protein